MYFNVKCMYINRYLKPLSSGNADEEESLGLKMLHLSKQVNVLQQQVEEQHLDRRSGCWEPVEDLRGIYGICTMYCYSMLSILQLLLIDTIYEILYT